MQNLFSIVDQLVYRRLSRPREAERRVDALHTGEYFRIPCACSVRPWVISQPLETMRVILAIAFELSPNDGGEHVGIGANQRDLLFRRCLPPGRRNLSRLG